MRVEGEGKGRKTVTRREGEEMRVVKKERERKGRETVTRREGEVMGKR